MDTCELKYIFQHQTFTQCLGVGNAASFLGDWVTACVYPHIFKCFKIRQISVQYTWLLSTTSEKSHYFPPYCYHKNVMNIICTIKGSIKKSTCIITFIIYNILLHTLTLSVIVTPDFHTWYLQSIFRMLKETKKTYKLGHSFDYSRMSSHLVDVNYFGGLQCHWMEAEMIYDWIQALYTYTEVLWQLSGIQTNPTKPL